MKKWRSLISIILTVVACGCSWLPKSGDLTASITETGVSPTSSQEAVWLAAPRPGLSAVGKDYLFVGPMTVNREGSRRSYLWFAVGTTIDRHLTGVPKPALDTVVLLLDGTPMTFDLIAWDNNADSAPYPLTIDSYSSYAARVTSSQIRQLANADTLEAYLTDADGRSPVYEVVQGDPGDWLTGSGNYSASSRD